MDGCREPAFGCCMDGRGVPGLGCCIDGRGEPAFGRCIDGRGEPAFGCCIDGRGAPGLGCCIDGRGVPAFCRCIGAEQSLVGKLIGEGVGYIFQCSFAIVASVLSFTREESISSMGPESKKDAIFCIVFGALSGCATLVAAGIVGLVYRSTVGTTKPAEPEQIEAPKDEE